jgi:hypothetical protein
MNLKNHDIGKIAGCLVIAAGIRELIALIVHLILREEYGDVSFLIICAIPLGIGLYRHWLPAYALLLLTSCLGELFVIIGAIEIPMKIGLGKMSFPVMVFSSNVESYAELYEFLAVCGSLLAIPIYFLLTRKAREECKCSEWIQLIKKESSD